MTLNIFDATVIGTMLIAVVMGYRSGLLRSFATIFGYLLAAPVAVVTGPKLAPLFASQSPPSDATALLTMAVIFLAVGIGMAALLRHAVGAMAGDDVSLPDRAAGAALGVVRILLLAILMVLVFERIIPPKREPAWLAQSQLRPLLAAAGEHGVRTLPPDVTAQIDRMKKQHGI